ncbi:protein pigeon-like isoform X2 [Pomacea canaliculata]|uniref:protein pigeon-like isoform X2 n=1 Tax=Pomacea canaliculata TaxID=400727 RepID=UPI000D7335EE|nr:protein pigeon-like isoform X2 [Pomacea canaliculata]
MLVFLHKESIGLYQIHMARIGDRGIMMSGQPVTEQIVRKFVWMQWDAHHQRLYYVYNVRHDNAKADTVKQRLSTIQFYGGGKYDNMIDVPINFPFPHIRSSTRSNYADIPLHQGIPDILVNAVVLTQNNGNFCFCYQEYIHRVAQSSQTTQSQDESESTDISYHVCMVHHAKTLHGRPTGLPRHAMVGKRIVFHWFGDYLMVALPGVFCHLLNVSLEYEPCHHILLHNQSIHEASRAHVTAGSAGQLQHDTVASSDTSQLVASDGAAAAKAEEFVDTKEFSAQEPSSKLQLDLASASEGSFGLLPGPLQCLTPSSRPATVHDEWVSDVVSLLDKQCLKLFSVVSSCYGFSRETGVSGTSLYDSHTGFLWRLALNQTFLIQSFKSAYWQTRMAIIHYLLMLRNRDYLSIRQVFEVLAEDTTEPELHMFLAEYLVASTFNAMRKQTDKETLRLLNFTTADTFRGQFEKNAAGERLARVSYTSLDSVNISTKVAQDRRRRPSEDSWDLLRRSLRLKQMPPPSRFSHDHVIRAMQEVDSNGQHSKKWTWVSHLMDEPFLQSVKPPNPATIRSGATSGVETGATRRSRSETAFGSMPLFLQASVSHMTENRKLASSLTEQLLLSHLLHHLKKEARIKAQNIAKEYILCQAQQSHQLCHLLWSIYSQDNTTANETFLPLLNQAGTDNEYKLFQVFERFFLATQEIVFPRPSGFMSYFTALGFICLNLSLFLQYVDRGVLQLTPDFILKLLEDLPDGQGNENNNAQIKFTIISRLPKPFAEDCFRYWNHPVSTHFTAREQVAQLLQEGLLRTRTGTEGEITSSSTKTSDGQRTATTYFDTNSLHTSPDPMSFKPLTIFIRYLEETAAEIQHLKPGSSSLMYNTQIIEDAALAHMRRETSFDLSSMNF